jgi:hypothetical protein
MNYEGRPFPGKIGAHRKIAESRILPEYSTQVSDSFPVSRLDGSRARLCTGSALPLKIGGEKSSLIEKLGRPENTRIFNNVCLSVSLPSIGSTEKFRYHNNEYPPAEIS